MENNPAGYDAFISYRHTEPDKTIAKILVKALEGYRVPKAVKRKSGLKSIKRVFRDTEELPTSSNLSDDIQNALKQSRKLIVICSPSTPESRWVAQEIKTFIKCHGREHVLSLLIAGEPEAAFPYALRFVEDASGNVVALEPLAADIRGSNMRVMKKRLRVEKLRLLSPMLDVKFDDLKQRHREQKIKKALLISLAISIVSLSFGIFASYQSNIIGKKNLEITEKNEAIQRQIDETLSVQSRFLADLSYKKLNSGDQPMAVMLALAALPKDLESPDRPYTHEAEFALRSSCSAYNNCTYKEKVTITHGTRINGALFSPDGKSFVTIADNQYICIWDAATGMLLNKCSGSCFEYTSLAFVGESNVFATGGVDGTVEIWDMAEGNLLHCIDTQNRFGISSIKANQSNCLIIVRDILNEQIDVIDSEDGRCLYQIDGYSADFYPDGNRILVSSKEGLSIRNAHSGALLKRLTETSFARAVLSSSGRCIMAADTNEPTCILNGETGDMTSVLMDAEITQSLTLKHAAFTYDEKYLAAVYDSELILWDIATGERHEYSKGHTSGTNGLLILENGYEDYDILSFSNQEAQAIIWGYYDGTPDAQQSLAPHEGYITTVDAADNAELILTGANDGTVKIHRYNTISGLEQYDSQADMYGSINGVVNAYSMRKINDYDTAFRTFTAFSGRSFILTDTETGEQSNVINAEESILSADLSDDGKLAALGCVKGIVKVFDIAEGEVTYTYACSKENNTVDILIADEGTKLLTAHTSLTEPPFVILHDILNNAVIKQIEIDNSKNIQSDGAVLLYQKDGTLFIYDIHNNKVIAEIECTQTIKHIQFNRLQHLVAFVTDEETLWVVNTATGNVVYTQPSSFAPIRGACFSGSTSDLFLLYENGLVQRLDVQGGKILQELKNADHYKSAHITINEDCTVLAVIFEVPMSKALTVDIYDLTINEKTASIEFNFQSSLNSLSSLIDVQNTRFIDQTNKLIIQTETSLLLYEHSSLSDVMEKANTLLTNHNGLLRVLREEEKQSTFVE